MTIVNSPERLDFTDRLPNEGSIEALTPTMLEIVAVGAIATQFELRMPCSPIRARRAFQSSVDERSMSTSALPSASVPRCSDSRSRVSIGRMPLSQSEPR